MCSFLFQNHRLSVDLNSLVSPDNIDNGFFAQFTPMFFHLYQSVSTVMGCNVA